MLQNIEEYWWVYIIICNYLNCGWGERTPKKYTYFINDNPVACITEIKYTLRKHYFTTLNHEYNVSDFKDIVKEAIKEGKRQDKIRFNKNLEDNRKKLYDVVLGKIIYAVKQVHVNCVLI